MAMGHSVARVTVLASLLCVLVPGALAQKASTPDVKVCGRALEGTVRLDTKSAVQQSRLLVELLTGPTDQVLERIPTDKTGRFRIPGGVAKKGSVWLLRVTGPGKQTTLVEFTIDPACKPPEITIKPGQGQGQ